MTDEKIIKQLQEEAAEIDESLASVLSFVENDFGVTESETAPVVFLDEDEDEPLLVPETEYDIFDTPKPKITARDLDFLAAEELTNFQQLDDNVRQILNESIGQTLVGIDKIKDQMEKDLKFPSVILFPKAEKNFRKVMERTLRVRVAHESGKKVRTDTIMLLWAQNEEAYRKSIKSLEAILELRRIVNDG